MKKITIIIPIYNTERYLAKCFDSIISQDLQDIEIICIDDGSTDGSSDIIKEYKEKDPRFYYYHQKHSGVSVARNLGLTKATGEYIWFVDSDDFILNGCLKQLYCSAKDDQADILVFSGKTTNFWKMDEWLVECLATKDKMYNSFSTDIIFQEHGVKPVVWNKLFSRTFLKKSNVVFPIDIAIAEDQVFDFMIFPEAKKIKFSKIKGYVYRTNRDGSAMNSDPKRKENEHLKAAKLIYNKWEKNNYYNSGEMLLKAYLWSFLNSTFQDNGFSDQERNEISFLGTSNIISNINKLEEKKLNRFVFCCNYIKQFGIKHFLRKCVRKILFSLEEINGKKFN